MRYLYTLPLTLLLLVSCKNDKEEEAGTAVDYAKTDWAYYKLKGKVKSFSEKSYTYAGSKKGAPGSENQALDIDVAFNSRGMQVTDKRYNAGGLAEESVYQGKNKLVKTIQYINNLPGITTQYSRDKKGNVTSIIRRDKSNAQIDRVEMKFQGKNMVEKNTYNNQDHPIDMNTYVYDKSGNMTGESNFMGIQSAKVRVAYAYDEKGHKTEEMRYTEDKLVEKTAYLYKDGKLVSKETSSGNSALEYVEKYVYDKNGNLTVVFSFDKPRNLRVEETYTYDNNNNRLSYTEKENEKLIQKTAYTYDKNNNLTAAVTVDATGKKADDRSYAYEYDSNNNWTKKIVTIKGEPAFVVERTYTYHE